MEGLQVPLIKVVRTGLERACKDFTLQLVPLGFSRSKKMLWVRPRGDTIECISFFRRGSTYGSPRTASVDIRVSFFVRSATGADQPQSPEVLMSDSLRNSGGHVYHLRFNASSWSTYDRCINDLSLLVEEHGLPWLAAQSPN
jgi:hypothetical protein